MPDSHDRRLHERVVSLLRNAVRESEEGRIDLLEFLDGLPDCIGWTGPDLRYRFVNRAYADWFGLPRHKIIGRSIAEICGEETYELLRPYVEQALAGTRVRFEQTLSLRGAPPREIVTTLVPRVTDDGESDGWLTLVEDVTGTHE